MITKWQADYDSALKTPPTEGSILTALDPTKKIKLNISLTEGSAPFMYCLIYLPCIVGVPPKWSVRDMDDIQPHGWKGILLPKARDMVIRNHGLSKAVLPLTSIKVCKLGTHKDCLLVEVNEP